MNASSSIAVSNALCKRRYFPTALIDRDIAAYNVRVADFNTLKTAYDVLKDAYNEKVA